MSEVFNYCQIVGRTDVGRRRPANEDSMSQAVTQNGLVAVVCDGMGGHVGGATASRIAVTTIISHLSEVFYEDPRVAIGESIDKANLAILRKAQEQPELQGMGSTCVLLLVRDGKVYLGHVGDSRIYLIRSRRIRQLTKDHSYVQMLVDCGEISKEQMEHHPRKNEITNALGLENMQPATVCADAILPEAGDCFLLCSDGLSGMVSDDTIAKVVGKQAEMNAQERVDKLVDLANLNGGVDNITAELVEFSITPGTEIDHHKTKPNKAVMAAVMSVVVLVVLAAGYWWYSQLDDDSLKEVKAEPTVKTEQNLELNDSIYLGTIEYAKDKEIVEVIISKQQFIVQSNNRQIFRERVKLDPQSLEFDKDLMISEFNSVSTKDESRITLLFRDKAPGNDIEFSFRKKDSDSFYKFTMNVKYESKKEQPQSVEAPKVEKHKLIKEVPENQPLAVEKESKKYEKREVSLSFKELSSDSKLVLYYGKRSLIELTSSSDGQLKKETKEMPVITEVLDDVRVEDELYWKSELNKKDKMIIFRTNIPEKRKEWKSKDSYWFSVPCQILEAQDKERTIIYQITITKEEGSGITLKKKIGNMKDLFK